MARLLFVRHGESAWNAEHRWQGWADPPLSPRGEEQARDAAPRLAGCGLVGVVSSDLVRATRTAEILAGLLELGPVHIERGLRERNVGDLSGHTTEEIEARWPGLIGAWRAGLVPLLPNGERNDAFNARVVAAASRVADMAGDDALLVVSHGGVIRALECHAGTDAQTLTNLGGRWFDVSDGDVRAGPIVALLDPGAPAVAPVF